MADSDPNECSRPKRLASVRRFQSNQMHAKREIRSKLRKVSCILKKKETERTEDEIKTLHQLPDIVKTAEKNAKRQLQQKERVLEIEDEPDVLDQKCKQLAHMLLSAKNAIVYTGAGISTAASIPDYRGPNGVWTLLKKGQSLRAQDLVDAEPTYTHMCITKLFKERRVKFLVSQNCDGLHIRSGFPRNYLSEVHGNMFIEICKNCKPQKEYLRLFDVTERTAKGRHKTGRTCTKCGSSLYDSIVHFGEKGGLKSPHRWKQAAKAASRSDLIICLGSSLKVLRRYACLWRMDMRPEHRPKLVIVNLQWTPKDDGASLKIHGRCDDVLRKVADHLALTVPQYRRETDPLCHLHTPVQKAEELISSKKSLQTYVHKPVQPTNIRRKAHPKVSNSVSPYQQHRSLHYKNCDGSSSGGSNVHLLATSSESHHSDLLHTSGVFDNQHCKEEAECCSSKTRHILSPIRMKLEQMLKKRGVVDSVGQVTSNGKVRQRESNIHGLHLSSCSPLPGIQNFLLHSGKGSATQQSHPFLCNLLNNAFPSQLTEQSPNQEHNVFRVDLSTNPISITTTHGFANNGEVESASVAQGEVPGSVTSNAGIQCQTILCASNPDYVKLVRNIHFDHSYAKNSHKSRPKVEELNAFRNSHSTVNHEQQSSHQFAEPSVIAVSPRSPSVQLSKQDMHLNLCDPDILATVQQVVGDVPATLILPASQDTFPPLMNSGVSMPRDKVVINLNSDTGFAFQCSYQPYIPAMQNQNVTSTVFSAKPSTCSSSDNSEILSRNDCNRMNDSVSENPELIAKRKAASVPGWFGKGLRVRRKRTL